MTNHGDSDNHKIILNDNNLKSDLINTTTGNQTNSEVIKLPCWKRYFRPIREGSLRGSTFALASITFGSGCLAYPYAVAQTGPIVALFMLILVVLLNYYTMYILLECGDKSKIMDYNGLVVKVLGRKTEIFYHINNYIGNIGVIISYQYAVYGFALDLGYDFCGLERTNLNKFYIMLVCMFCIQIPLSLLKKISALQYASIVGTVAIVYSILVIIGEMPFYLINYLQNNSISVESLYVPISWNYLDSFSIFMFGFCSHNAIFQVFNELKRPTFTRCKKALNRSFSLEIVLYVGVAFAGYFSTFDKTPDIFFKRPDLEEFKPDYLIKISKLTLFICIHCSMALSNNIMRQSTKFLWFQKKEYPFWLDMVIVFLLYSVCNTLVFFVDNVSQILGIVGGFCTVVICFANPILIHINLSELPKTHYKNICRYCILVMVAIVGTTSTVKSIIDIINK
jgi:amino acid permease